MLLSGGKQSELPQEKQLGKKSTERTGTKLKQKILLIK